MLLHFGVETIRAEWRESVVSVGTFDGVHGGHRELIKRTVASAKERECPSIVVTFDRNPTAIVRPDSCPPMIASLNDNVRGIARLGISVAVILEFSAVLSRQSAQDFFDKVLIGHLRASKMVVGHDFAFGNQRVGTPGWLAERIETEVVQPHVVGGVRVSSSHIRKLITEGDMGAVLQLRGEPFEIPGVVVSGQKLGRTIGFPTLNIARSFPQVTPKDGVYAGFALTSNGIYNAAIGIGLRPTVNGTERTIEAYLLDYSGESIYGESVSIGLTERLRDEERFESLDELCEAMSRDVARTRELNPMSLANAETRAIGLIRSGSKTR